MLFTEKKKISPSSVPDVSKHKMKKAFQFRKKASDPTPEALYKDKKMIQVAPLSL